MKNNKLSIEKFRILELSTLSNIKGGTDGHGGATEIPTYDTNSAETTYTGDTDVPCPDPTGTVDNTNGNDTIPTLNSK
jgi:hypothetical protein